MFFLEIKTVVTYNFQTEQLINIHIFISYFLIISKEFLQSGSPGICYNNLLKVPETSSSDNNWSTSKRTKRNKLPLFKRCKPVCRHKIHYPSAHWSKNVGKNLHFLNSSCEIRQIKAKITLVSGIYARYKVAFTFLGSPELRTWDQGAYIVRRSRKQGCRLKLTVRSDYLG